MTIFGLKPFAVINLVVVLGTLGAFAWQGYQRRRKHWTAGSWIGFGLTLLVGCALTGFTLYFSAAVDDHDPWVGARGSNTRALWIVAAVSCLFGGGLLTTVPLMWFARGKAKKPFPLFGAKRRKELGAPPADYGQNVTPTPAVMNVDHEGPKRSA